MWHCVECLLKGALLSAASSITGRIGPAAAVFDYSAATAAAVLLGPEIKLRTSQKLPLLKTCRRTTVLGEFTSLTARSDVRALEEVN